MKGDVLKEGDIRDNGETVPLDDVYKASTSDWKRPIYICTELLGFEGQRELMISWLKYPFQREEYHLRDGYCWDDVPYCESQIWDRKKLYRKKSEPILMTPNACMEGTFIL